MTPVVYSLLAVAVLSNAVSVAPMSTSAATYYYEPIVPYGPYPAPGYMVSAYLPRYTSYRVISPAHYPPRKTEYDQDQYEDDEPKYYYGGKFKGMCPVDGLYYKDEKSYVVCSNGYASHQPCPPGTKTDKFPSYKAGFYYGSSDLCSANLVNLGYSPYSYTPQLTSYDNQAPNSYEKKPVTSYGSDQPKKDTYIPPDTSYDSPEDPYSATYDSSAGSSYHAAPSYPPQSSYQQPQYPSENAYSVDQPQAEYTYSSSDPYHSPADAGSYPPSQDSYSPPSDSYKPSPPTKPHPSPDTYSTDHFYKPSYHAATYKQETQPSYSDKGDH